MRILLLAAAMLLAPSAARAEWREARSTHFIVYTEGSEKSAIAAAARLEKFDFLLRTMARAKRPAESVAIKIYMMANTDAVADTMAFGGGGVAGYYSADIRGPYAVTTRAGSQGSDGLSSDQVLLHELTHHFMRQYFPAAYPSWYSEGYADFFGSALIRDDDVIEVGRPVANRYGSFQANEWLGATKMLTAKSYADVGGNLHLLYAQGWLLTHYLILQKERAGQLDKYLAGINAGLPWEQAARDAFGDLSKLDGELRRYSRSSRLTTLVLPFKKIEVGPIATRVLAPVEQALLLHDLALSSGVPAAKAVSFAAEVRTIAARFPDAPYALRILTEAERLAGNDGAAGEAVARWLAAAPGDPLALMHKGKLDIAALQAAKSTDPAAWANARRAIAAAAKAAPNEPQVLRAWYDSHTAEGKLPPPEAQNALVRAFDLLPQDDALRFQVASDFEARGMIADAIAVIRPAAYETRDESEMSEGERKKREENRAKYRLAGQRDETETPLKMLARLEALEKGAASGANR